MKYVIRNGEAAAGFKFNFETDEVVLGGKQSQFDFMSDILFNFFDVKELKPKKISTGKIKFEFDKKSYEVVSVIRNMRKYDYLVQKVNSLERIYR